MHVALAIVGARDEPLIAREQTPHVDHFIPHRNRDIDAPPPGIIGCSCNIVLIFSIYAFAMMGFGARFFCYRRRDRQAAPPLSSPWFGKPTSGEALTVAKARLR